MKVVSTFSPSSSVLSSIKCRLIANSELEFLAVGKLDRLDVYSLQPEGLRLECGLQIWGRILAIKAVPVDDSAYDNLVVLTDHPDPELIFLSYTTSRTGRKDVPELKTLHHLSLYERNARPAEFFNGMLLDTSGVVLVVSCYAGKLKVVLLESGGYENDFDVSIPELSLLALTFISSSSTDELCLAILHIDHQQRLQLLSRDLDVSPNNEQFSPKPSTLLPPTPLPQKSFPGPFANDTLPVLIHIAAPPSTSSVNADAPQGGILILGGKRIIYYDLATPSAQLKAKGKSSRTEKKKKEGMKSGDKMEIDNAKEKEGEREMRKRKVVGWVEWPWSEVTGWCKVVGGEEGLGNRFFVGDAFGRLAMVSVDLLQQKKITLLALGETSPATTLTYLTSNILYLGSHYGDSQLLRINSSPVSALEAPTLPVPTDITTITPSQLTSLAMKANRKGKGKERALEMDVDVVGDSGGTKKEGRGLIVLGKGSYLSILEVFKNIAPIVDAALVDTDGSGQHQIITCSGGRNTGSLNIVRSGADFQTLAVAEGLSDIVSIWPMRALFEDTKDTHILLSTLQDSHLFRFEGGSRLARVYPSLTALVTNEPTLALGNIPRRRLQKARPGQNSGSVYVDSSLVVQVTKTGVWLVEYDMALGQYTKAGDGWVPGRVPGVGSGWNGRTVVAAGVNASQVVVALSGARLVVLNLSEKDDLNIFAFRDVGDTSAHEISAVSCTPLNQSKNFAHYIAASFWGSNRVKLFSPEANLDCICEQPSLPALPRSLLLHNFGQSTSTKGHDFHPHLLVGLTDGTVICYALKSENERLKLVDQNIFSLGDLPVFLSACQVDSRKTVFACGSRASILFWERETLRHSPVILKDIAAASRLNTSSFSSCLALATSNGLLIGDVRDIDKMHIRSIPLGLDNPRRITYHNVLKMYGVACVRTEPVRDGEPESVASSFKILNEASFSQLGQYDCGQEEEITAVHALLVPFDEAMLPCFAIGSCRYKAGETEPTEGQLLVFWVHSDGSSAKLAPATSTPLNGCTYAFTDINGMIAVAVGSSVVVFRVVVTSDVSSTPSFALHRVAEWNHNYYVISLVSHGTTLMLGDAISSVTFLKLDGTRLETLAKDYGSLWPVCLQRWSDRSIIGANAEHNLFSFTLEESELETALKRDGSFYINDMVNKFIPGALTSLDKSDDATLQPKQIFFTSSGRIGVVVDIGPEMSLHMTELQRNMAQVITPTGGLSHTRFRAPRNNRGRSDSEESSVGFLDGDFVERFLTFPHSSSTVDEIMKGTSQAERLTLPREKIQKILERLQSLH